MSSKDIVKGYNSTVPYGRGWQGYPVRKYRVKATRAATTNTTTFCQISDTCMYPPSPTFASAGLSKLSLNREYSFYSRTGLAHPKTVMRSESHILAKASESARNVLRWELHSYIHTFIYSSYTTLNHPADSITDIQPTLPATPLSFSP